MAGARVRLLHAFLNSRVTPTDSAVSSRARLSAGQALLKPTTCEDVPDLDCLGSLQPELVRSGSQPCDKFSNSLDTLRLQDVIRPQRELELVYRRFEHGFACARCLPGHVQILRSYEMATCSRVGLTGPAHSPTNDSLQVFIGRHRSFRPGALFPQANPHSGGLTMTLRGSAPLCPAQGHAWDDL
jgi:hypothetical protein